jgi:hypothetical protein
MSSAKKPAKIPPKDAPKPKPSKDTVYVDVEDDITTVIDKVEGAGEKIVALVLPKRASVLQSTVNMRLLKRAADKAEKSVVLITSDEALLPLAGIVGLHTAKNLQSKPEIPEPPTGEDKKADEELEAIEDEHSTKLDYHRSIGELAAAHAVIDDGEESIDLDEEPDDEAGEKPAKKASKKDKKLKIPDFDRFRLKLLIAAGAGVALLVFLFLAVFVLPKATVVVKTTSVPVSTEFSLTTSDTATALDQQQEIIPAQLKTSEQTVSQSVTATGQQNQGTKASGTVKLSIACGDVSGSAPKVPAGTGVTTSGLTYITQETATLDNPEFGPCRFTDTVNVVSQSGGAKYNIGPASFTVQGYSKITGSSSSPMTGGTDNIITIVTQSDVDKVKQQITAESSDQFSKQFTDQLDKEGLYVISSTLKLGDPETSASPGVGQPASTANVTVKVKYTVIAVKKDDLKKAVTDKLNEQMDKTKQKLSTDDVLKGLTVEAANQKGPAIVTLNISQTSSAVPIIDVAAVKKQAAGQKTSTIKSSLTEIAGVEDVEVHLSPFWVSKAPKNVGKITIVEQELKGDQTNATP